MILLCTSGIALKSKLWAFTVYKLHVLYLQLFLLIYVFHYLFIYLFIYFFLLLLLLLRRAMISIGEFVDCNNYLLAIDTAADMQIIINNNNNIQTSASPRFV